jgi:octaprenyl-diphosphate synthase
VQELARRGEFEAIRVLSEAANAMTVGEMRQLTSHDALGFSEEDYDRLIACKTASLMSAACEMGALVGADRWRAPLARFGFELGMAFQITDDLLDYTAREEVTGKPAGLDLKQHKVTLPLIAALRAMDAKDRRVVEALFRDPEPSDDAVVRVTEIVERNGGLDYARARAAEYADRARAALAGLPEGPALVALREAVDYAVRRTR